MQYSWRNLRSDFLWGLLSGSVVALLAELGRSSLSHLWTSTSHYISKLYALLLVISLALLGLILPRFAEKLQCLFRSWKAGFIRGAALIWAVVTFLYWAMPHYLLLWLAVGFTFQALTWAVHHHETPLRCTAEEIADWIPRGGRGPMSAVSFDNPITKWEQDAIGRPDFVERVLGRALLDCEPAIGITADFGEGKSSVLHLIRASIEKGGRAIAVPFRTWLPGSEETLLDSLFGTAAAMVRKKYFLPPWRSTLRKYGHLVLGAAPKGWGFLADVMPPNSQLAQIEELANLFSRLPMRVVFLLDEIDRMHEEELSVLLKILRGAPELTNVTYVCAFSKDALARLVARGRVTFGRSYLEKFFTVQLPLPRIDEDLRRYLFADRIDAIVEREEIFRPDGSRKGFDENRNELWQLLSQRLTNLRLLGQILRAFDSSLHSLKGEVNAFDMLVIECLRLLLPETHEFVFRNSYYFHEAPNVMERWPHHRFHFDEKTKEKAIANAFNSHFEALPVADRELAISLLALVFPSVKAYAREKGLVSPVTLDLGQNQRISQADFFPRYFIHAVPATRFGQREMDRFISSLPKSDEQGVRAIADATYPATDRDDLRRLDFLRKLKARVNEIPDPQAGWLASYLAETTSSMKSDHIAYVVTKGLLFELAGRHQGTEKMQQLLQDLVLKSGTDHLASDIVYSTVSERKGADEITNWSGFDPEQMKATFGKRMRIHHLRPARALNLSAEDLLPFSRWRVYVPGDEPYIVDYFRSAFDADVSNLGAFLQWLLPGNIGYSGGGPIKFIESFYFPVADLATRLANAENRGVQWGAEHQAAVTRFKDYLKEEQPPS